MYKVNQDRQFSNQNISFLVAGTLIILITSLFMNACTAKVAYNIMEPNIIVMNTIIAAGASGLFIMLGNQYQNIFIDSERVQQS